MESPLAIGRATPADLDARREAELRGSPFLLYRDGEGRQHIVDLDESRGAVTLGRRFEADIALPWDYEVSRLHAELVHRAGEWTIADDGLSQNGTFVNELRVEGRRRLHDGDLIRIGRTLLAYCAPGAASRDVTLVPGELPATPRFSEAQQRLLTALCRPLFADPDAVPASDEEIAAEMGETVGFVRAEIDHLVRSFGISDMPPVQRREEIALLAMRTGIVSADS